MELMEQEKEEYSLKPSQKSLEELKNILKSGDKGTLEAIMEYLQNDSYLLIISLANQVTKDTVSEVYQYRLGALSRNEALVKLIKEVIKLGTFIDRKIGQVKNVS